MQLAVSMLDGFRAHLIEEERSSATIEKYLRDVGAFIGFLPADRQADKEQVLAYKDHLASSGYAVTSINSMLAAINRFFDYLGCPQFRVRPFKRQRTLFRDRSRELTREEYVRLVKAAEQKGNERLYWLLQTICATGIRVSEVRFITVEAARSGRAVISLKGKVRTILLPGKLCRKLLKYAHKQKIASGELFITKGGRSLSRGNIWADMKRLCTAAGVERAKVFPHNLRHLFARSFYSIDRDIVRLADVLGHTSIETTRIYTISSGDEHARKLEQLHLLI